MLQSLHEQPVTTLPVTDAASELQSAPTLHGITEEQVGPAYPFAQVQEHPESTAPVTAVACELQLASMEHRNGT